MNAKCSSHGIVKRRDAKTGRTRYEWVLPAPVLSEAYTVTVALGEDGLMPMSHSQLVEFFTGSAATHSELAKCLSRQRDSPLVLGCAECSRIDATHYIQRQEAMWVCLDCLAIGFADEKLRPAPLAQVTIVGTSKPELNGRQATVVAPSSSKEAGVLKASGRVKLRHVGPAPTTAAQPLLSLSLRNVIPSSEAPPPDSPALTRGLFSTDRISCCRDGQGGWGIFATRPIEAGTLLLHETPLVIVHFWQPDDPNMGPLLARAAKAAATEPEATPEFDLLLQHAAQRAYEQLPAGAQGRMLELCDNFASLELDDDGFERVRKTPGGILRSNCFDGVRPWTAVLFERLCRMNHACEPNTSRDFGDHDNVAFVRAVCPIAAGEELTTSYLAADGHVLSVHARREKLHAKYGFWCQCVLCQRELLSELSNGVRVRAEVAGEGSEPGRGPRAASRPAR